MIIPKVLKTKSKINLVWYKKETQTMLMLCIKLPFIFPIGLEMWEGSEITWYKKNPNPLYIIKKLWEEIR